MQVAINIIDEGKEYTVNSKTVYKDPNEKWIAQQELTPSESKAFFEYLKKNSSQHCRVRTQTRKQ